MAELTVLRMRPGPLPNSVEIDTEEYPHASPVFAESDIDTDEKLQARLAEWAVRQDETDEMNWRRLHDPTWVEPEPDPSEAEVF